MVPAEQKAKLLEVTAYLRRYTARQSREEREEKMTTLLAFLPSTGLEAAAAALVT